MRIGRFGLLLCRLCGCTDGGSRSCFCRFLNVLRFRLALFLLPPVRFISVLFYRLIDTLLRGRSTDKIWIKGLLLPSLDGYP